MQHNKELHELNPLPAALNNTEPNDLGEEPQMIPDTRPVKKSINFNMGRGKEIYEDRPLPPAYNPNAEPVTLAPIKNNFSTHFFGKRRFTYSNIPDFRCNTYRILLIALGLYFLEYGLIFGFSIGAYFGLHDTFRDTHWVIGLIFLILYLLLSIAMIILVASGRFAIAFFVKFWEFAAHLMLLGWATAYLEFAIMSLSYMMLFDILLLIFWVC